MSRFTPDHDILGIKPGATLAEIKQAYRALARQWHPDRYTDPTEKKQAEETLKRINLAYERLKQLPPIPQSSSPRAYSPPSPPPHRSGSAASGSAASGRATSGRATSNFPSNSPLSCRTWYDQAAQWGRQGRYREALEALSRAIQLNPSYAEAYRYRGFIYSVLGHEKLASLDLERAERLQRRQGQPNPGSRPGPASPGPTVNDIQAPHAPQSPGTSTRGSRFHSPNSSAHRPPADTPGSGTPGSGTPGSGTPGSGTPGSGTPGSGTPGSGSPGAGTSRTDPGSSRPSPSRPSPSRPSPSSPDQSGPSQFGSSQSAPSQAKSSQSAPSQAKSSQAKSSQAKSSQASPGPSSPGPSSPSRRSPARSYTSVASTLGGFPHSPVETPSLPPWDCTLELTGHTRGVITLAPSRDGQTLISSGWDNLLLRWNLRTGKTMAPLVGHGSPVLAIAPSPDGQLLASGSQDRTLRLWHLPTGTLVRTLRQHEGPIESLAFTGDGQGVISAGRDGQIVWWEVSSGQMIRTFGPSLSDPLSDPLAAQSGGRPDAVKAIALNPEGQILVVAKANQPIRFWSLRSGEELRVVPESLNAYPNLALNSRHGILATATGDGDLRLWSARTGSPLRIFLPPQVETKRPSPMRAVALSADGQVVAGGNDQGEIHLWAIRSGELLATMLAHDSGVSGLAFNAGGTKLYSGGSDRAIRVWAPARTMAR